jgi:hypothetical protein
MLGSGLSWDQPAALRPTPLPPLNKARSAPIRVKFHRFSTGRLRGGIHVSGIRLLANSSAQGNLPFHAQAFIEHKIAVRSLIAILTRQA